MAEQMQIYNDFFERMISLIPPQVYSMELVSKSRESQQQNLNSKYLKFTNAKKSAKNQIVKEQDSDADMSSSDIDDDEHAPKVVKLDRRIKLHPEFARTVVDMQKLQVSENCEANLAKLRELKFENLSLDDLKEKFRAKLESVQPKRNPTVMPKKVKNRDQETKFVKPKNNSNKLTDDAESESEEGEDDEESGVEVNTSDEEDHEFEIKEDFQFNSVVMKDELTAEDSVAKRVSQFGKKSKKKELLKKLTRDEKKLASMDQEKKEKIIRKQAVKSALMKAAGVKVYDSAASIQKQLDQRKKQKKKSAKQWEERKKAQEEKNQTERLKKQENQESRKNGDKKAKKSSKKTSSKKGSSKKH